MKTAAACALTLLASATVVQASGAGEDARGCAPPRVSGLRASEPDAHRRVEVRIHALDDDGVVGGVSVEWGDKRVTHADLTGSARSGGLVDLRHRYRAGGRYTIKVTAESAPATGCGTNTEKSRTKRIKVRVS